MNEILGIGLTFLIGLIGVVFWNKIAKILKVIKLITNALEDKTLTKEEVEAIRKELGL